MSQIFLTPKILKNNMTNGEKVSDEMIETLSPIERKVIPFLNKSISEIIERSGMDEISVMRALRFLESKGFLKINVIKKTFIDLGFNGVLYKKNHLPERRLIIALEGKGILSFDDAKKTSGLSDNEFKAAIGVLKGKALISMTNGKIKLEASKEELIKKNLEEQLIDLLPIEKDKLAPEMLLALENLKNRKEIIEISEKSTTSFVLSEKGREISGREIELNLIEEVNSDIIKNWSKGKKFRRYDIHASVPKINGGRKHFVSESIEQGKKIWLELGFEEMNGGKCVTSFWNFDALFTAQDHPVREMQDTFFIKDIEGKIPDKKLVDGVKKAHESGISGSKGWQYSWNENTAKKVLLRTHTTCLSSQTLYKLRNEKLPRKFFAMGKCFRNEAIDWSHGFEFNQSEGIVIDQNANFRHLLGYLKEFYKKMGFDKIRVRPSFFPYTEPSLEIDAWHYEKKKWLEIGGAGIFRPEVTVTLFGKAIPVLAWGPGFDRIMMMVNQIKDMREVYKNDLSLLRTRRIN